MNNFIERIYYNSPVMLQHALVTLYGLKLYRQRYGGKANFYTELLKKTEQYNEEEMTVFQKDKFLELTRIAIEHVPYYKSWARSHRYETESIQDLSDLKRFPIIEKGTIREDPYKFVSSAANSKIFEMQTSGTSGTPLSIFCDTESRTYHYAFFTRLRSWFGLKPCPRRATIFSRIIMPQNLQRPPFWRHDLAQNNLLMSSYHLSEKNLEHYISKLSSYKPEEIIGYPSTIYPLALFMLDMNIKLPKPPVIIISTAETLLPYQRDVMEKAFECPVINQYGSTEMAFFASECEKRNIHFHPEHALIEILDEENKPVEQGRIGTLVATGLVNKTMPLIRYKIGDALSMSDSYCQCGRAFPIIGHLEGRCDDLIYTKNNTPVGRLSSVFKGNRGIHKAQVIQQVDGSILIYIVPASTFDQNKKASIENEMRKRVGDELKIQIKTVQHLENEKNGKFKSVISHYKREN